MELMINLESAYINRTPGDQNKDHENRQAVYHESITGAQKDFKWEGLY